MDRSKYIVEDDDEIFDAGFSGMSQYDIEREALLEELDMYSHKSMLTTWLLCFFFGLSGFHHFFNGRFLRGLLYFFTVGLFGLGWIYDQIKILSGKFRDRNGRYICDSKVLIINRKLDELDKKYARY